MNTKLDNVTTQYRKFNDNQALTEGQLNEFLDYFEDQDRLSRTRLNGVGIVCGFKTSFVDSVLVPGELGKTRPGPIEDNSNTLAITQGAGVTTDGDLIMLRRSYTSSVAAINFNTNFYKYYREYDDVAEYKNFSIGGNQIPLLELITESEYGELPKDIAVGFRLVKDIDKLFDKIVILYLESYSNDENPCQDADCDHTGSEQISNLKVLLADPASLSGLMTEGDAKDNIYRVHNAYETLFDNLPKIENKRIILDPSIVKAKQLKIKFQEANTVVGDLSKGFDMIAATLGVSMNLGGQTLYDKLNSLLDSTRSRLDDYQYRYDLLKDLIDTYNEIKGLLLRLNAECCPDIAAFPKHLMLGPVGAKLQLGDHTDFRHGFYNSPITTNDDENYERVMMLANRFVQKVNGFQTYIGAIKITPSNINVRLGDKAIPYYYNVNTPLLTQWNYEKTKTDRETYNLSYHTANLAEDDFVQNPLNYNIDNNDFYRIEGHLGLPYKTALQNINDLKAKYGLGFDVIALFLKEGGKPSGEESREKTVSIDELRKQLESISSEISGDKGDAKSTLLNLSRLDEKLKLLNKAEFSKEGPSDGITVVKEDPRKSEVVTELLSEFLERKSGLEHMAGVEPGGTFVLIYEDETNSQVLADFSLPYVCCSKGKPNIPPIAVDDKVSCMHGQTIVIPVLDNDYDADNDLLTVVKKSDPSYGTVILNNNGTFVYTHDGSSNLSDSFTYCVNDGKDDSNIATVFIDVKSPPVAVNDHASTEVGGFVDIAVKANDYDLGNTALTVFIKTQPTHGTASLNGDGTIKYKHNGSTNLTDSFTYYINDGEFDSNIATVTITIAPPPCDSGMDVVFIFDYTGSMAYQIEEAKAGASDIVETIRKKSEPNAYRLGIVLADEFRRGAESPYGAVPAYTSLPAAQKFINNGPTTSQWITAMEVMKDNNVSSFTMQLGKLNNSGGGLSLGYGVGGPEPTDMALSRVIEHNIAGAFRNNVAKYVIIITDEVPGGDDDKATAADVNEINRLKNECIARSIKVIVLGSGVNAAINGVYIWQELATGTGGSWNASYKASDIQSAIINGCGGK